MGGAYVCSKYIYIYIEISIYRFVNLLNVLWYIHTALAYVSLPSQPPLGLRRLRRKTRKKRKTYLGERGVTCTPRKGQ